MGEVANTIHKFIGGKRGLLWRKGQVNGTWKKRYFMLEKKKLKCFEDELPTKVVGELVIYPDTAVFDIPGEADGRKHLFYISVPGSHNKVFFLAAESAQCKLDWMEAITDAVHGGFKLITQPRLGCDAFYPNVDMCVGFENNSIFASNDNKLKPSIVENVPQVMLRLANATRIYPFIMIDLDSIHCKQDERAAYLHWGIVNIEGGDIETGIEIQPYLSPAPEYNSGVHRFVFLLFDQSSDFDPDQLEEIDAMFQHRESFPYLSFLAHSHLAAPVAVNGFYAGWEEYCGKLHERMNCTPPDQYFSPKQEEIVNLACAEQARIDLFVEALDMCVPPPMGSIALVIEYGDEDEGEEVVRAHDGFAIPPAKTQHEPFVSFFPHPVTTTSGKKDCNVYTLMLVDPDAPSRVNHSMWEYIHWIVMNIPAGDVTQGATVLPYVGPASETTTSASVAEIMLVKVQQHVQPTTVERRLASASSSSSLHFCFTRLLQLMCLVFMMCVQGGDVLFPEYMSFVEPIGMGKANVVFRSSTMSPLVGNLVVRSGMVTRKSKLRPLFTIILFLYFIHCI